MISQGIGHIDFETGNNFFSQISFLLIGLFALNFNANSTTAMFVLLFIVKLDFEPTNRQIRLHPGRFSMNIIAMVEISHNED
jgi:hypothetical protein